MQTLTLQQLFGVNAVQTATELVIKKADLVAVSLTPASNNRAEQLLVAILLKALENFQGSITDEDGNYVTDQNNLPIEYDNRNLWELLEIIKWGLYVPEKYTDRIRHQIIIHSYTHEV
ncbi:hypothetical protein VF14_27045 [Nostoc linckia z18]|uniref:Uncharacterized protein n=2 Tax=Nostoc linckia TaxID=92942 RepID=A0A9Q5Z6C2_NOSLI|nr:hypothetical protein [Nostoc linckia]PHK29731.1 hypothetical protein VF12_30590 [Nostoc linckia z15]PHK42203.1 hypothetical protein VF13_30095 [Nostoc linckia z16]PHJ59441.1 hypothetical protein VF02_24855 [Nostoc linckia z1]PHJ62642.1 hypothetical protein VF05_26065 [Nostoc linckia z3]PHJ68794.1 hypothetical protein VF03_24335 [Nostoc linckia z2]